jgi:hypothetical protein
VGPPIHAQRVYQRRRDRREGLRVPIEPEWATSRRRLFGVGRLPGARLAPGSPSVATGKKLYEQQPYPEPRSGRRTLSYGDS